MCDLGITYVILASDIRLCYDMLSGKRSGFNLMKTLSRLCVCAGSSEYPLLTNAISALISCVLFHLLRFLSIVIMCH